MHRFNWEIEKRRKILKYNLLVLFEEWTKFIYIYIYISCIKHGQAKLKKLYDLISCKKNIGVIGFGFVFAISPACLGYHTWRGYIISCYKDSSFICFVWNLPSCSCCIISHCLSCLAFQILAVKCWLPMKSLSLQWSAQSQSSVIWWKKWWHLKS